MIKIGITGPESTGKTSLAQALGQKFDVPWVSEYARTYLENQSDYKQIDLKIIAQMQWKQMQNVEEKHAMVIYDTEMTVMKIWSQFKYGSVNKEIEKLYNMQQIDHYFLCDIDIPWAYDPLREHPNDRKELLEMYKNDLDLAERPYTILSGNINSRIDKADLIIRKLFKDKA